MKFVFAILVVCIAASSAAPVFNTELDSTWAEFKQVFNKVYDTEGIEMQRRAIFEANIKYIQKHNLEAALGHHTYTLKMNNFADMTNAEFVMFYNGFNQTKKLVDNSEHRSHFLKPSNVEIPDSVDWRTQGYVTPIKDQKQCGSCWAFSAVAALEGQHFKQTGKLVSLSEQNLVDCSYAQGNMGCNGGWMDQAFTYVKVNKGIDTEDSYPYEARDDTCKFNADTIGATDVGFTDIKSGDEDALTTAIATVGPVSVAIDASQSSFQFYHKGIYTDKYCSPSRLDHGVTAVGYGTQGTGKDYYIVKNSWGTVWGDQGYILMARNQKNMCGIATAASYPLV